MIIGENITSDVTDSSGEPKTKMNKTEKQRTRGKMQRKQKQVNKALIKEAEKMGTEFTVIDGKLIHVPDTETMETSDNIGELQETGVTNKPEESNEMEETPKDPIAETQSSEGNVGKKKKKLRKRKRKSTRTPQKTGCETNIGVGIYSERTAEIETSEHSNTELLSSDETETRKGELNKKQSISIAKVEVKISEHLTADAEEDSNALDWPTKKQMEKAIAEKQIENPKLIPAFGNGKMGKKIAKVTLALGPRLNLMHSDKKRMSEIGASWAGRGRVWGDTGVEVMREPFTCCFLPAFLNDAAFLTRLKEELGDLEFIKKNNDLYKFQQTMDLKAALSPHITALRNFLYGPFREWLEQVMGFPLDATVDMGCSSYQYTDVLLCHDDKLEGRRVAYILYLVPPWGEEDGGTLDLFATDDDGHPGKIVRSLVPEWNAFVFFEVSPVSFHQVSEVLSRDKVRLSINGWFHGPQIDRPERPPCTPTPSLLPTHIEEDAVYAWVNNMYLDQACQRSVRRRFRIESSLMLNNFLDEDKYEELAEALRSTDLVWGELGPANRRSCQILQLDESPNVIRSCVELLSSEALFLIFSQLTGLKLHRLAPPDSEPDSDQEESVSDPKPVLRLSIHRWSQGSYTLLRDDCMEAVASLDVHLFVNVAEGWSQEYGGFVTYIAKDEDEELLTVMPRGNCLTLVYRDAQTLSFTKHVNASVTQLPKTDRTFHTFTGTYYE